MSRRSTGWLVSTAMGAAVFASSAAAATVTDVVPGITHERIVYGGPQVVNVVRIRQGPLTAMRPILTGSSPSRRARLTDAMRARLGDGAVVAVNGDFFNLQNAYPSGLLMLDQELVSEPEPTRSALLLESSGLLRTAKLELQGTWQAVDPDPAAPPFLQRGFIGVNRPPERDAETIVYTPRYGELTPTGNQVDALVDVDGGVTPRVNVPFSGTVQSVKEGGGSGVAPGKLVISGVGTAANRVREELVPNRRVVMTFAVTGIGPESLHGLGGGPVLVSDGAAVPASGEGFSSGQLGARTSRTAIGQAADGTVLLVMAEGPLQGSPGLDVAGMANFMASLGVRTAIGMDAGGSAGIAIRDRLVSSIDSERSITDALVVTYGGVQLTNPTGFISPNGDGVDDSTSTVVRSAKPGTVRVTLATRTGRTFRVLYNGPLGPPGRRLTLGRSVVGLREGTLQVVAKFRPKDGSIRTSHRHSFITDRTAGFLKLKKVGTAPDTKLRIRFRLTRAARVTMRVRDGKAVDKKLLLKNRLLRAGEHVFDYDMKRKGKPLDPGTYVLGVRVQTPRGLTTLSGGFRAVKVKPPAGNPATPSQP